MNWFAAHVIMAVKWKKKRQTRIPVWENIILLQAETEEEAFAKAEQRGRADAMKDDSFCWGSEPAEWTFAGVRKITLCQDETKRPRDGTEITYTEMEVASEEALHKLVEGEPVSVKVVERFAELEETTKDRDGNMVSGLREKCG